MIRVLLWLTFLILQALLLIFGIIAFVLLDFDMMTKQGQVVALLFIANVCYLYWKQPYRIRNDGRTITLKGDG